MAHSNFFFISSLVGHRHFSYWATWFCFTCIVAVFVCMVWAPLMSTCFFCFVNWEVSEIGCCTCTLCLYSELSGSVKPMYFVCWLCMERCGLRLGGMENLAHSSLLELLTSYGCSRCLASLCGMACFGGHFLFKTPWTNSPLPSVIALSLEE